MDLLPIHYRDNGKRKKNVRFHTKKWDLEQKEVKISKKNLTNTLK